MVTTKQHQQSKSTTAYENRPNRTPDREPADIAYENRPNRALRSSTDRTAYGVKENQARASGKAGFFVAELFFKQYGACLFALFLLPFFFVLFL